jgi:hypothetical protein
MAIRRAFLTLNPSSSSGNATFSAAVRDGIRLKSWNTNPNVLRRRAARSRRLMAPTSAPSTTTLPPVGWSSPPARFSSVDLPEPLGPMTATSSPACTVRVTPSSARTAVSS